MPTRRLLALAALIAAAHGVLFIIYQSPDWATVADQEGYRRLGRALAETGRFTRFPESAEFVPEVIRTPGYPIFLAAVYTLLGTSQIAVAAVQTALFVVLVLLVYFIARECATPAVARAAAVVTALYPTFPYFAALVMTELWTTVVLTLAVAAAFRASRSGAAGDYLLTGFLFAIAALSRPAFVLLPFAYAGLGLVLALLPIGPDARLVRPWAWVIAVFLLSLAPWFAFNDQVMGRFALAPAGGVGRGLWEGSWHGTWRGRVHDQLTQLAAESTDTATLDARVSELAAATGSDPGPMQTYVHQWREIRRIWDTPEDPLARAEARIAADREYQRVALENIRSDLSGHIRRRLTYGLFVLWSADIWVRYSDIDDTPPIVIRAMWAIQGIVLVLAAWGGMRLLAERQIVAAWLLLTPMLYVTAVHVPLLTEARQSLPVKPLVLIAAAIGGADLVRRFGAGKIPSRPSQPSCSS
jgi:4-amino-4-deoxy-L-arabinose transferase-like glycosyltransferase